MNALDIDALELTLVIYFVLIAAVMMWLSGSWLMGLAVLLCAVLALMIERWMLSPA